MDEKEFEHRRQALKDFIYLPLFYLIPDEIAQKRKLDDFPRDPYFAATTQKWIEVYQSKLFQVTLLDTWGWMMWQCLGIRGSVDNYSQHDPFVLMTFSLPMWAALLAEQGIHKGFLAAQPEGTEIPFLSMEMAAHNCGQITKRFWAHPKLKMREVFEIVKKHRDPRDYSSVPSHAKMDFERSYYHIRSKTKVIPDTDENGEPIYAPHYPNEFAEVETQLWFEDFLSGLNEKDQKIARLMVGEYTQKEIAAILDYSGHSGVNKRISFIRKEFRKYMKS